MMNKNTINRKIPKTEKQVRKTKLVKKNNLEKIEWHRLNQRNDGSKD